MLHFIAPLSSRSGHLGRFPPQMCLAYSKPIHYEIQRSDGGEGNPCAGDCMYGSPNATARWKHIYSSKGCTERTTTHAGSHLVQKQPSQIAQNRRVIWMVLAEGGLYDFHRTTAERLGILIFSLWSTRRGSAATGTPWSIAMDRILLSYAAIEESARGNPEENALKFKQEEGIPEHYSVVGD